MTNAEILRSLLCMDPSQTPEYELPPTLLSVYLIEDLKDRRFVKKKMMYDISV